MLSSRGLQTLEARALTPVDLGARLGLDIMTSCSLVTVVELVGFGRDASDSAYSKSSREEDWGSNKRAQSDLHE